MAEESKLKKLKEDYSVIQRKHCLPSFEQLNVDFNIEKAADVETDFLLREVRGFVAERCSNYLRFVEVLLNPVNVPMFIFSVVKTFDTREKDRLNKIYQQLAKNEVKLFELDIFFSEEKEAKFINETYKMWQEIKKDILDVFNVINKNWDNKTQRNNKGYFG